MMSAPINPLLITNTQETEQPYFFHQVVDKVAECAIPIILVGVGAYFGNDFYSNSSHVKSLILSTVCILYGIEQTSIVFSDLNDSKWSLASVIGVAAGTFSLFFSTYFMGQALVGLSSIHLIGSVLHLFNTSISLAQYSNLLEAKPQKKQIPKMTPIAPKLVSSNPAPKISSKPARLISNPKPKPKVPPQTIPPAATRPSPYTLLRSFSHTSIKGFRNLGNTCYANSMIKCLVNNTAFDQCYAKRLIQKWNESPEHFAHRLSFQTALRNIKEEYVKERPDAPTITRSLEALLTNPLWMGTHRFGSQHDAHELYSFVSECLEINADPSLTVNVAREYLVPGTRELLSEPAPQPNPLIILNEPADDLDPEEASYLYYLLGFHEEKEIPISDLIRNYTAESTVEFGGQGQTAIATTQLKHQDVSQLRSLGFQLPRTHADHRITQRKFTRFSQMTEDLQLPIFNEATGQTVNVRLRPKSFTCHHGSRIDGGHYISYAKDQDGNWFKHNDSSVEPVRLEDCLNDIERNATVAFYDVIQ